jgi:hypothetical protein
MEKRDITNQIKQETRESRSRKGREETRVRRCGIYNGTGYNARTCQIITETSKKDIAK